MRMVLQQHGQNNIPSFRIAFDREQRERKKPFRDMFDKPEKKQFDEMLFDIPRLYLSACSYSVHTVRPYLILMSILLHGHKQLAECLDQKIEQIEGGGGRKQHT